MKNDPDPDARRQEDLPPSAYEEIIRLNNELVNIHRELALKNAELNHLNQLKNRFLGMAAHDMRNPINAIRNFSEMILNESGKELNDRHRHYLTIIGDSSDFMLRLIDDLLDFTRIEAGGLVLNVERYNLADQIARICELNQPLAGAKQLTILYHPDEQDIMIVADRIKIGQVVGNLVHNAIKYSNPDSEITVSLRKDGSGVVIEVNDQGVGISPERIATIFDPFTASGTRGTWGEKSTGLGLSIARRIVEAHRGTLRVESAEGKGSRFIINLL